MSGYLPGRGPYLGKPADCNRSISLRGMRCLRSCLSLRMPYSCLCLRKELVSELSVHYARRLPTLGLPPRSFSMSQRVTMQEMVVPLKWSTSGNPTLFVAVDRYVFSVWICCWLALAYGAAVSPWSATPEEPAAIRRGAAEPGRARYGHCWGVADAGGMSVFYLPNRTTCRICRGEGAESRLACRLYFHP